jgi:CheY-like chemotaxis protein
MTERRFTILVADDDADARLVMRAALRKAGYEVRLAEGGEDALRQFRAEPSDMVMLDVDMPGLCGLEVCTVLRAEAGPLLPIVMVTGMDDLKSVESAYEHGATDFIAKPVNWALIGHRVRYLFRGYQAMVDLRAAEARNAALLSAIPDLLFELDIDGLCIDYRAGHTNLLAAPADKLVGRTVRDLLPATAADICMASLRAALAQGSSTGLHSLNWRSRRATPGSNCRCRARLSLLEASPAFHRAGARHHRAQASRLPDRPPGVLRQPHRLAQSAVVSRSRQP